MVLRPLDSADAEQSTAEMPLPAPAWAAVAERQKRRASAYWLISQPDHARLSGELAAGFVSPHFPRIDSDVAQAIGCHDAGWSMFEAESRPTEPPMLAAEGKPLSFVEFAPDAFLAAWTGSIDRAEAVCAAGGIIVSRHFCELGSFRLKAGGLCERDSAMIREFMEREHARQHRLLPDCKYSAQELKGLLETLQFCDLLSLYLCSGARHAVEFPQRLTDRPVRITCGVDDLYRLDPSPFQTNGGERIISAAVTARYFSANGAGVNSATANGAPPNSSVSSEPKLTTLQFLLA